MTKCPKCKFYNICKGRLNETVENCVRFKSIEPTNEEWLKSLNTDEFSDFLEGVAFDSNFRNGIEAEYRREDKDYCYGDRPKIIKAWLKEVHK